MKTLFIALFACSFLVSNGQHRVNFSSYNFASLLQGGQGAKFQLETINGFSKGSWFAGVGTGLDWYFRRSIPLFASINKQFAKKKERSFFATANGGVNFPWKDQEVLLWGYQPQKSIPGFFGEAGLGYRIGLGKSDALLLQAGYSYKYSGEKASPVYQGYMIAYPTEPYSETYHYHLRRIAIRVGWEF